MKFKFLYYLVFIAYTLLFLFYPGDSYPFHTFAFNRDLFDKDTNTTAAKDSLTLARRVIHVDPVASAQGIYVVDLASFSPVYGRAPHQRFLPASTTKVITALIAYDIYKPDDVVTVKNVVDEGQTMGLIAGEKITVENLLYGLLIHSGNDAAFALADHLGRDKFVALMNKKAQSLHMTDSSFTNPAGFDDPGQYTSPYDLALAGRELLKNKYLAKIVSIKEIIISDTEYKHFHTLTNVNKLLGELEGVGGLKTGHTDEAGENLITFYRHGGYDFLIVLLKSEDRFADTTNIVNWISGTITHQTVRF